MTTSAASAILRERDLRVTHPRVALLKTLAKAHSPLTPTDIEQKIDASDIHIDLVTIYRALKQLEEAGLVHGHPCDGSYSLCTLPDDPGHHGFLHCESCGKTEEFQSPELCVLEDRIAKKSKFRPLRHMSEILGICASCS